MRAVYAEDGVIHLREVPEPTAGPGQVLVRVRGAGLNAVDRMMMAGSHGAAATFPLGSEAAGEVLGVGQGVSDRAVGQRVMGQGLGAFADLVLMEPGRTLLVPDNLSWAEAAGAPVCLVTAHDALLTAGGLRPGASVLVNAASSGVGVAALQLARLLGAGVIIASSTTQSKLDALAARSVPFDLGVLGGAADFVDECLSATSGRGVDVVIDNVGGAAWPQSQAAVAIGGRIVSVGRLGGNDAAVNLDEIARKRVSLVGVTFRTRSSAEAGEVFAAAAGDVMAGLTDGRLRVLVDRTFPLERAAAAEDYLREGIHVGKVVLLT
jgi:NADPH2:quinone reductase